MKEKILIYTKNMNSLRDHINDYTRGIKYDIAFSKSEKDLENASVIIADDKTFIEKSLLLCTTLKFVIFISDENIEITTNVPIYKIEKKISNYIAEYVMGAIISLSRKFFVQNMEIKSKTVNETIIEQTLAKNLGIIYLNNETREIAKIAGDFGINVNCLIQGNTDKNFIDEYGISVSNSISEVMRNSDFILVHSKDDKDKGIISFKEFQSVKKNAYIIDISETDVIDTFALLKSIEKGDLSGAMIDVTDENKIFNSAELLKNNKIFFTYKNIKSTKDIELNAITDGIDQAISNLKNFISVTKPKEDENKTTNISAEAMQQ